ncbi:hypothetical protein PVBG_05947 [Plasmodium vivax Brazil I]|uniref:Uncharacterized protein n=1 Tax=Plasmodium vivax (strain Brazil I) TaxID=1033975 RepID=A0A0J9SK78_PLAV1|nr:hypothetical protein PVBG_05947 [Plasmodium vivax Brazil I]
MKIKDINYSYSLHNDKTEYYNICMKILRNLDPNGGNQVEGVTHSIRCNHVNNWLYNSKDKINLSNKNIMDRIFDLSGTLTKGNKRYECLYYSYDENYEDPINIIRLRIFDDNMEIIKNTLMRKGQQNYNLCQKYVCECVNIYNKLNRLYCSGSSAQPDKHKKTCDMLEALKTSYEILLSFNPEIRKKLPSLEATQVEHLAKCPLDKRQHSLAVAADDHSGSSTSKISTTIGTMAGVSSVFALLYKVNTKFYLNV